MARILHVEDDPTQKAHYSKALRGWGYDVVDASSGMEALNILSQGGIDCVVSDIAMPEMDGLELIGKVVNTYPGIPFIFHTAYPIHNDNFMTWAADAVVVKSPETPEKLCRVVQKEIERRKR